MPFDDMFGYDDFVGSNVDQDPMDNEDKFYDPSGITEVEQDWEDYNGEF